jgi:hypothetical protein
LLCLGGFACEGEDAGEPSQGAAGASAGVAGTASAGNAGNASGGDPGTTAGAGSGGAGGTAGTSSAGSAGSAGSGAAGSAGSSGAAGSAGSGGDSGSAGSAGNGGSAGSGGAPPERLNPSSLAHVGNVSPVFTNYYFVSATDMTTQTEIGVIDLDSPAYGHSIVVPDHFASPVASKSEAYVLLQGLNQVQLLGNDGLGTDIVDLNKEPTGSVPGSNRLYVTLRNADAIAIIDRDTKEYVARIPLGQFADPADTDGNSEVDNIVYDARRKRLYFTLARYDILSFPTRCNGAKALLVALDTSNPLIHPIVDLNGDQDGEVLELSLQVTKALHFDESSGDVFVLGGGCMKDGVREGMGLEVMNVNTGRGQVTYTPENPWSQEALVVNNDEFYIKSANEESGGWSWHHLTPNGPVELMGVPTQPVPWSRDLFVGAEQNDNNLWEIVTYDTVDDMLMSLVPTSPWKESLSTMPTGAALLRRNVVE